MTGADIAASDDLTGSAVLGGDWELERSAGSVETATLDASDYSGVLTTVGSSVAISVGGSEVIAANPVSADVEHDLSGGNNNALFDVDAANSTITITYSNSFAMSISSFDAVFSGGTLDQFTSITRTGGTSPIAADISATVNGKTITFNVPVDQPGDGTIIFTFTSTAIGGNNAPTITGAPADITVTEDTASNVDLSGVAFADSDGDNLTVTLTASAGSLAASSGNNVTVSGSGTGVLTLSGSAADINNYLDTTSNVQYTGASNASGDNAATLTVKANDGTVDSNTTTVKINITNINDVPTDIALSDAAYSHSEGATNIVVGSFSATDADTGESFTYALVSGSGDTDNAKFTIDGTNLRVTNRADMPAGTYNIRVQVNDGDATFEKSFSITVSDDIAPTISSVVPADNATGVSVADSIQVTFDEGVQLGSSGTITLYDITGNNANSLTIDVGNHNGQLSIVGNKLTINPTNNLMAANQYAIQITAGGVNRQFK